MSVQGDLVNGRLAAESNMSSYARQRLHRSVSYEGYVLTFAKWAAGYAFLVGFGGLTAVLLVDSLRRGVVYPLVQVLGAGVLCGVAMAGMVGLLAMYQAKEDFSRQMNESEEMGFSQPQAQPQQPQERPLPLADVRTVAVNGEPMVLVRRDKVVEHAKQSFAFKGKQLDMMLSWVRQGHLQVRRDANPQHGPGLAEVGIKSADYSVALAVLKGRGLVDEANQWTAAGVAWLEAE